MMEYRHTPVMLKEVMEYLDPRPGQYFIDCTLGGAGYTAALARAAGDDGKVLAIDMDPLAIANAQKIVEENKYKNIILANDNFKNLSTIVKDSFPSDESPRFDGIVFDLGLSGAQLEDGDRGFAFSQDTELDMSFSGGGGKTAHLVNDLGEDELTEMIKEYGEERFARLIARKICERRKTERITTTGQLNDIILSAVPKRFQHGRTHPSTRTFQALRIATNGELENIREALPQALALLKPGGRVAVVSFHSLEDRIVKIFFKKESVDCLCPPAAPHCNCGHKASLRIITRKIVTPSEEDAESNPRARSAKLRVAEKI